MSLVNAARRVVVRTYKDFASVLSEVVTVVGDVFFEVAPWVMVVAMAAVVGWTLMALGDMRDSTIRMEREIREIKTQLRQMEQDND